MEWLCVFFHADQMVAVVQRAQCLNSDDNLKVGQETKITWKTGENPHFSARIIKVSDDKVYMEKFCKRAALLLESDMGCFSRPVLPTITVTVEPAQEMNRSKRRQSSTTTNPQKKAATDIAMRSKFPLAAQLKDNDTKHDGNCRNQPIPTPTGVKQTAKRKNPPHTGNKPPKKIATDIAMQPIMLFNDNLPSKIMDDLEDEIVASSPPPPAYVALTKPSDQPTESTSFMDSPLLKEVDCKNCKDLKERLETAEAAAKFPEPSEDVLNFLESVLAIYRPRSLMAVQQGRRRLLSGYDVYIPNVAWSNIESSSGKSGRRLLRNLIRAVFTESELAESRGLGLRKTTTGSKLPLDTQKVQCLKLFVKNYCEKNKWVIPSETEVNKVFADAIGKARGHQKST